MVARERLRLKRRRRILPNQIAAKRHELNPNTIATLSQRIQQQQQQ